MKSIGNIIQEHRKRKNMTQQELGKLVFVSKQAVSKWENGRAVPDLETLRKLSEILDIKLDEVLGGTVEVVKRSRRWLKILVLVILVLFIGFSAVVLIPGGGLDYLEHRTQSGVTLLTVYENGRLLTTNDYTVDSSFLTVNAENGYKFYTYHYGTIDGTVCVDDEYEVEYGFINTNNWHNIQIRLDIETHDDKLSVRQTVTFLTEGSNIEVFITEKSVVGKNKVSVYREGI